MSLLRPDDIIDSPESPLRAIIIGKTFLGAATLYRLELPTGNQLEAIFTSHIDHFLGENVGIEVAADHLGGFCHTRYGCRAQQFTDDWRTPLQLDNITPRKRSNSRSCSCYLLFITCTPAPAS